MTEHELLAEVRRMLYIRYRYHVKGGNLDRAAAYSSALSMVDYAIDENAEGLFQMDYLENPDEEK